MSENESIRLEWTIEPPRRRTMMVCGGYKRVEFPRPLLLATVIDPTGRFLFQLNFAAEAESAKDVCEDTPLLVSPLNAPKNAMTHVYALGHVCYDHTARHLMRERPPSEVFWSSNFKVLPEWLSVMSRDVTAPVNTPRVAGLSVANVNDPRMAERNDCDVVWPTGSDPLRVRDVRRLRRLVMSTRDLVVTAPWLSGEVLVQREDSALAVAEIPLLLEPY